MQIIGRKEIVELPQLQLGEIVAKIDTGAYTSSIHCVESKVEEGVLKCLFVDENDQKTSLSFDHFKIRLVKSSNGISESRYSIHTNIRIGSELLDIELTLSDRSEMRHPILLGRKFLRKRFLVDVSQKNKLLL
ncbi:Uncharacterized conserved protein [Spirosomataceae bacterium TFI 002]|nr:Uncharacterized conserved protein [Spirosomataceae bacterium TFI 002]